MSEEREICSLYHEMLGCWNKRSGPEFAALFTSDGNLVGFDGSTVEGRAEINLHLSEIFAHHKTPSYIGKVRSVRFLKAEVAVINAVAGMVPPGQSDLHPALNAIQTLIVTKQEGGWRIAVYQNTPAAFHGRPELSEKLTAELRQVVADGG